MTDTEARDLLRRAGSPWSERIVRSWDAPAPPLSPAIGDEADRALAWWRDRLAPDEPAIFERRLRWSGLTEESARRMLVDDGGPCEPEWGTVLRWMRDAMASAAGAPDEDDGAWLDRIDRRLPAAAREVPFAHLLWPAVQEAQRRLVLRSSPLGPDALEQAGLFLLSRLSSVSAAALMTGMAAGRSVGESFLLAAPDRAGIRPARRRVLYGALCRAHAADRLSGFLSEYPVLARLMAVAVGQWLVAVGELADRLRADEAEIAEAFGCALPLHVVGLEMGSGDTHRDGRSVCVLDLKSPGDPIRIVYKPRDMRTEARYHDLATWFLLGPGEAPMVTVLAPGPGYGYVSYLDHRPAAADELAGFYREAGRLLGLLHLLGTTDAHLENLVAHGGRLVLVDPETLFEGRLRSQDDQGLPHQERRAIDTSVLRTGMLPSWAVDSRAARAVDISALGCEQRSPGAHVVRRGWAHPNTDDMAWGVVHIAAPTVRCLPVAAGTANPVHEHVEHLVEGFASACRQAADPAWRKELLQRVGGFEGLPRRIVVRATMTYDSVIRRAAAPDALRSENARGAELDRLSRSSLVPGDREVRWPIFLSEVTDTDRLDIPYFEYPLGSLDLRGSAGTVTGALADDGLRQALLRIEALDDDEIEWQSQLIRAAVAARSSRMSGGGAVADEVMAGDVVQSRSDILDGILEGIESESVTTSGRRTWLALEPVGDGLQVQLGLMGPGLYAGTAGLAVFLGSLADVPGGTGQRAAQLAEAAWQDIASHLLGGGVGGTLRAVRDMGLGFTGAGGLLRALGQNPCRCPLDLRDELQRSLLAAMEALVDRDTMLDFMGGCAGAVGPLAALSGRDDRARTVLRRAADRLLAHQGTHGGWLTPIAPRALTGLSHGASGFAVALAEAAVALGDERYLTAAERGLEYERGEFVAEQGNWRDLRVAHGEGGFMVAWCHGASGIALARSRMLMLFPEFEGADRWHAELDIALATTRSAPPRAFDHLCCGNAGRAALLAGLGRRHSVPGAVERADAITDELLKRVNFRLNGHSTGSSIGQAGLMTGTAGIGMHLLDAGDLTGLLV